MRISRLALSLVFLVLGLASPVATYAQSNAGTVRGSVLDPSGAVIKGATVEIQNPVSRYNKSVETDAQGNFEFDNVPYNNYHLSASAKGFQGGEQDVNVRSPLAVEAKISMTIGNATTSVTVTSGTDLVENDTTTHTDVDRELFDKLPLESQSSSLSSLATLPLQAFQPTPTAFSMDLAITPRTLSPSTASRLRTSRAKSSPISSPSTLCSRWKLSKARRPPSMAERPVWCW